MSLVRRALAIANAAAIAATAICLILLSVILFVNIVARNFVGRSYIGTETLATYLMVWLTFLGAAYIVCSYGHVAIDLVLRAAGHSRSALRAVAALTCVCGMATAAYLMVYGTQLSLFLLGTGVLEPTLGIYQGVVYVPVAISGALMLCNYASLLIGVMRNQEEALPNLQ